MVEKTMDKIVALAKSRGFVYPGSEIYGGLATTWAVSYTHLKRLLMGMRVCIAESVQKNADSMLF